MNVLLCPLSDAGYLYPAIAVGLELSKRQHQVQVLARPGSVPVVAASGLPSLPVGYYGEPGTLSAARWSARGAQQYQAIIRSAIDVHADILVTSVLCLGALLAAEVLDLPVIVLGFAAHVGRYQSGAEDEPAMPVARAGRARDLEYPYAQAREQLGLAPRTPRAWASPLAGTALLLRGDPAFEYPGGLLPDGIHYVGPCDWEPPADPGVLTDIDERLRENGKPVVYVHLSRVFGGETLWPWLNAAFTGGPFQAVVEQGRSPEPQLDPCADILLVRKAWMGPLIDRAGLVMTNGTSSPVLGALLRARPLVVAPNGSEQPLLAEACVRTGVAVRARTGASPAGSPAALLDRAWHDTSLRHNAQELGRRLATAGGAQRAADIVELVTGPAARSLARTYISGGIS